MIEDKLRNVRQHFFRHIPSQEIANPVLVPTGRHHPASSITAMARGTTRR